MQEADEEADLGTGGDGDGDRSGEASRRCRYSRRTDHVVFRLNELSGEDNGLYP